MKHCVCREKKLNCVIELRNNRVVEFGVSLAKQSLGSIISYAGMFKCGYVNCK